MLGIANYTNRELAFDNSDFGNPFIRSLMSFNRFSNIVRAWHWEDYTQMTVAELKEKKKSNPFFGVKQFLVLIAFYFHDAFNPGQKLDIDEQSIPWKGRHRCRCYNPKKPEKWHFKVFCLNDSETGYLSNFYIYEGKDEERPVDVPATEYPFHKLLGDLERQKYQDKNHIVFSDNWYTSMNTMTYCLEKGIHSVGTVKINKKNLPGDGIFPKTGKHKKQRGAAKMMKKTVDGKDIFFIAWMDNKPVHLLSTLESYQGEVQRSTTNAAGNWTKMEIPQPTIIRTYNSGMGGTDSCDQRLSYIRPALKTVSWQPRIFSHFLNCAVFNAFVLYKIFFAKPKEFGIFDFTRPLMEQLALY